MLEKGRFLIRQYIRYPFETCILALYITILRLLSIDRASRFGRWVGQHIGGLSRRSKVAQAHLQHFLPDLSQAERDQILVGMWQNLGQVTMEYACLQEIIDIFDQRIEIIGQEHLQVFADGKPGLIYSAHIGNWEMVTLALQKSGIGPLNVIYREANNKGLNKVIRNLQGDGGAKLIAKGPSGARDIVRALKQGEKIALLVDQKMSDGMAIPFFGEPAMTASAIGQLALRFDCPILPIRAIRVGEGGKKGLKFKLIIDPPMFPETYRHEALKTSEQIALLMYDINLNLERWIRQNPEQWHWVHNRWPKAHDKQRVEALWYKQAENIKKYLP